MTKSISLDRVVNVGDDLSSPTLPLFIKTTDGDLVEIDTSLQCIWVVWCRYSWNGITELCKYFYFIDKELAKRKLTHIRDCWGSSNNELKHFGMYPDDLHLNQYSDTDRQLNLFREEC
tara:strand:+ start:5027 stop:5380 length:354 start_codon:yes stop_codon:yes gene_type:complete